MKLVSYKYKGKLGTARIGVLYEEKVTDLQEAFILLLKSRQEDEFIPAVDQLLPSNPVSFYAIGMSAIERAQEVFASIEDLEVKAISFDRNELTLGAPVPAPSKIICIGTNYADHVAEMKSDMPEYPVLFAKFSNAIIGPEDGIEKSPLTNKLDYEVELGVVIGKHATEVKKEEAFQYIAGYTIGNDISARDLQKRTPQWLQGKTLDRSTPIGPWLVTKEEVPDPSNLAIKSYVNGELRQSSSTKHLIFDIPYLVEFISSLITLEPGDIILTGTPDGVGFAMNPPRFLQKGDTVTLEIEKVGKLENMVIEKRAQ